MKITYRSIDGARISRSFKTLKAAQRFAHEWVGEHPDFGSHYAVSFDGVGKITAEGVSLAELFPSQAAVEQTFADEQDYEYAEERAANEEWYRQHPPIDLSPPRAPGCTCSDDQLIYVGCDCDRDGTPVLAFSPEHGDGFDDMPF